MSKRFRFTPTPTESRRKTQSANMEETTYLSGLTVTVFGVMRKVPIVYSRGTETRGGVLGLSVTEKTLRPGPPDTVFTCHRREAPEPSEDGRKGNVKDRYGSWGSGVVSCLPDQEFLVESPKGRSLSEVRH